MNNIRMIGEKGRVFLPAGLMHDLNITEGIVVQLSAFNDAAMLLSMELWPACDPFATYKGIQSMKSKQIVPCAAAFLLVVFGNIEAMPGDSIRYGF